MDFQKIKEMRAEARSQGNELEYKILTVLFGELETDFKRNNVEPTANDVTAKIKKFIKSCDEMKAAVGESAYVGSASEQERIYLSTLIPKVMSEDETIIALESLQWSNIGEAQSAMQNAYPGLFDRGLVAKLVRAKLAA